MRRLLLLGIALIVYGSLYPWRFRTSRGGIHLPNSWQLLLSGYTVRDAAVNLALYVPIGVAGYLALPRAADPIARAALVTCAACLLSSCIEVAQMFVVGRVAAPLDVAMNTIGAAAGAGLAVIRRESFHSRGREGQHRDFAALLLLACWIASIAFPFVPVISLGAVLQKLRAFLQSDPLQPVPLLVAAVSWYIGGHILAALRVWWLRFWLSLTLLLVVLQVFISGRDPGLAELAGAACGTLLFALTGVRLRVAAAAASATLVVAGLYPFGFTTDASSFTWLPFGGLLIYMHWVNGASILAGKLFLYGSAIWLMVRSGVSLRLSAAAVVAILSLVEIAQLYLPLRTPEITDPLLAAIVGLIFGETERSVARARQSG